jgi:hypothetical protein
MKIKLLHHLMSMRETANLGEGMEKKEPLVGM